MIGGRESADTHSVQPVEGEQVTFSDPFTNCVQSKFHAVLIKQAINEVRKDIKNGLSAGNRIAFGPCDHHAVVNYNNYGIVNALLVESSAI